jgi:hypothetical protein
LGPSGGPDPKPKPGPGDAGFGGFPIARFKFENVFVPEQPLKLYPTVMAVTFWSDETVKVIGLFCYVVPLHSPS